MNVAPEGEQTLYYWIAVGKDYAEIGRLNKMIMGHGPEYFVRRTGNYWSAWINKEKMYFTNLPTVVVDLYKKSLLILRTNIDGNGAIIAGNDSDVQHFARDTYSYMWPRDGALTAYALDMAGYPGITGHFFDFCLHIISKGKESRAFLHKYNPMELLGSWHPWVNHQENPADSADGTGLVLCYRFHFDRSAILWLRLAV
jgi:GH15 family glucan-1,4-alpha-glucosidase